MKRRWRKGIFFWISASTFVMVVFGYGCGQFKTSNFHGGEGSLSSNSTVDYEALLQQELLQKRGAKVASIYYGRQVLDNMISCLSLDPANVSQRTEEEFQKRKGSFSETGSVLDVTSPMMMGVASLAGEVCADLIESGSPIVASGDLRQVVRAIGLSCWGDLPTIEEESIIMSGVDESGVTGDTAKLFVCTSMLSSLAAIEN
ncbi:MAG: hypothetical protein D6797_09055 [Bdellovibrio sp.]|nr:MAG: hypothetical protein D6797_09055 [Bdellovibrio sp.]